MLQNVQRMLRGNMTNIKIFTTHNLNSDNFRISNDIFVPIGYNRDDFKDVPLDNKKYCELSTQYYAWKKVNADYYGFTHYRRFISFAETKFEPSDDWNVVICDYLNESTAKKFGLNNCDKIREEVEKYDVISIVPADLKKLKIKSVYEQYKLGQRLHIEDLDIMAEIVKEFYPDIFPSLESYMNGTEFYSCNMFIMKKDLFFEYSEFLFSVLAEFEKRKSVDGYSVEGKRTLGHLGERLFGIYYTYLKNQNKFKFSEKQMVIFAHTESPKALQPAFSKNNIGIVISSSEFYAPFASATIQSIIDCSNSENNYDLIILTKNMSIKCKNLFLRQIQGKANFSIRFFDVGSFFADYKLYESPTISIETYFRLVIPEILPDYDKVVYLDSDLIVKTDVAELYNEELGNNLLAGVVDVVNSGCVNGFDQKTADYYNIELKMKDSFSMINMGVAVMNCALFREKFTTQYLLEFALQGRFKFQDQDLLNIICEGKIKYLDPAWNFFADPVNSYRGWIAAFAPAHQYESYLNAKKNIKIVHYAGNEKPWKYDTCDYEYADEFWTVFIKTPFYGSFMFKHFTFSQTAVKEKISLFRRIANKLLPKGTRRREFVKKIYKLIKKRG